MFNILQKQNKLSEPNDGEKADSYLDVYTRIHSALQVCNKSRYFLGKIVNSCTHLGIGKELANSGVARAH